MFFSVLENANKLYLRNWQGQCFMLSVQTESWYLAYMVLYYFNSSNKTSILVDFSWSNKSFSEVLVPIVLLKISSIQYNCCNVLQASINRSVELNIDLYGQNSCNYFCINDQSHCNN